MKLTKQDFELALPVGISAHDEVYDAVSPAIATALDNYCSMLLGDVGIKRVTESEEDSQLKRYFNMLVCIDGFLSVFRQLDLVLTPTGFGIVSNDTISPASKQRVDALEGVAAHSSLPCQSHDRPSLALGGVGLYSCSTQLHTLHLHRALLLFQSSGYSFAFLSGLAEHAAGYSRYR